MDTTFAQRRRRRDLIVAVCLAAIAALVPLFVKDVYVQNIMVLTLMYAALSQKLEYPRRLADKSRSATRCFGLAPTQPFSSPNSGCCRGSACSAAA